MVALRHRTPHREPTLGDLVENYLAWLEGRPSYRTARNALALALKHFGEARAAADIRTTEFSEFLRQIYDRGAICSADLTRRYLHAAYQKAIRSEYDYTVRWKVGDWGLKSNPLTNIPIDHSARRAGQRTLSASEWVSFFRWLERTNRSAHTARAMRICMLTGQRLVEILHLNKSQYDASQSTLFWDKTKNELPHCIPLPRQAVALMDGLSPRGSSGHYFLARRGRNVAYHALSALAERFLEENADIEDFCARDLRRTWKTLAGAAGLSKEVRDRLQNHALSDVSSRHYDRHDYLDEKRTAMMRWSDYVDEILSGCG